MLLTNILCDKYYTSNFIPTLASFTFTEFLTKFSLNLLCNTSNNILYASARLQYYFQRLQLRSKFPGGYEEISYTSFQFSMQIRDSQTGSSFRFNIGLNVWSISAEHDILLWINCIIKLLINKLETLFWCFYIKLIRNRRNLLRV